jgi:hypothetical protein
MTTQKSTEFLLELYQENAEVAFHLGGKFKTKPSSFHNQEKVSVDVIREDEKIAIPVPKVSSGPRENEATKYSNNDFTPMILNEAFKIDANRQNRPAGWDPFTDVGFLAQAHQEIALGVGRLSRKVRRTVELAASQIFQSASGIAIPDANGNTVFGVNFNAKSTHFFAAAATWAADGSTGAPFTDVTKAADLIAKDGKGKADTLEFGSSAWARWLANPQVKDSLILNANSPQLGQLAPKPPGVGGRWQGMVNIGGYIYNLWTYDAFYQHPQTGTITPYIGTENVIVSSSSSRMDMTWGGVNFFPVPNGARDFLGAHLRGVQTADFGATLNAWFEPNGSALNVQMVSRPLPVPVAIDTFCCIDVTT